MIWLEYIILLIVLLAGFVLSVVTLPGTWLMCAALAVYAVVTRSAGVVGWKSIGLLLVLATVAEIIDTIASGAGAKKAGASRMAMIAAVIGGILGAIFLSFILFFPLGTIAGACIGCFVGAGVVELVIRRDVGHSLHVGFRAAWGRLTGIVAKIAFSLTMLIIAAWA
ncbi:MAG: DUF456 domain-containing protein, partial [Phycisphaerae bacterium]|nr:DUF456 domain-containing protein [Phycisphaerae bacterium]